MAGSVLRKFTRREFLATAGGMAALSLYGASSNTLDATHTIVPAPPKRGSRCGLRC